MRKKMLACSLALAMTLGLLTGCGTKDEGGSGNSAPDVSGETEEITVDGSDIVYHKAKDITTDNITLTYFHFDQDETCKYLAERFMQIYPNIKVNAVYNQVGESSTGAGDGYNDVLATLVADKKTPDVIMSSDCDFALSNMLYKDISPWYDTDPETKNLADTVNDCGLGCFETSARYAVPVKFFPSAMLVDLNVLEKLNIKAPARDWMWSDMIQLIKDATQPGTDGMQYYGLGIYNRLDSYYGIAASQTIKGEFGFNGDSFDLATWAVGEQEFSGLKQAGYAAPSTGTLEMEEWMGDFDGWCGASGHVALFSEAFWTFQGTWNTDAYKEQYNLDIVPYVVPAVSAEDATKDHHAIATIDFGGITTSTKYPREAYELLKFMSFGIDGWMTRIEAYNNKELVNKSGLALKYDVMPCPITKDEEVWAAYREMYCEGMDDEHKGYWKEYFDSVMQPIPFGWTSIAGYWNFCDGYFNKIGIHDLVDAGTAKAADYAEEGTRQANSYHATAMIDYFGPNGYDVLSDEEIQKYQNMIIDAQ